MCIYVYIMYTSIHTHTRTCKHIYTQICVHTYVCACFLNHLGQCKSSFYLGCHFLQKGNCFKEMKHYL